jgi:DNA replication protein DnaC
MQLATCEGGAAMSAATSQLQQATITEYAQQLRLLTLEDQFAALAEQAIKEKRSHLSYLEALLGLEVEERQRQRVARRIVEARFPKVKTLEEFQFEKAPQIPATLIRNLAEGGYLERSEPVIFLGEAGTGKTHLATGLAVAACRQQRRVRFTTAAKLVNELLEAKHNNELNRMAQRWLRYELIVIDELGYVAMPEAATECLFQVIAGRAEAAAVIVTSNLPFSEWTTMFPNARLCKAMLDRLTDQAHIIETGSDSYRFRRTLEKKRTAGHERRDAAKKNETEGATGRPDRRSSFLGHPGATFSTKKGSRQQTQPKTENNNNAASEGSDRGTLGS